VGGVWGLADFAKRSASEAGLHTSPAVTTNIGTPETNQPARQA
jgi:hypothetical protein